MKSEVPSGIPGIFPFVGHRNDIRIVEMRPIRIPAMQTVRRGLRSGRVTAQPAIHFVVIELFAPQQSCECLALDRPRVFRKTVYLMLTIKLIRFLPALRNYSVERDAEHVRRALTVGQSQPNRMGLTRRDRHHVMRRSLRSDESR